MKKNASLAIFLSILAVLVLIVILCSAVFCVSDVKLVWYNSPVRLAQVSDTGVMEAGKIKKGDSVFLLDRKTGMSEMEREFPYLKVLSIETLFPNKVHIHVMEREEVYAVKLQAHKYAIVDSEFKILRIYNGDYVSTQANAIEITGLDELETDVGAGEFLNIDEAVEGELKKFLTLQDAFYQAGKALSEMRGMVASVSISGEKMIINTFFGVRLEIAQCTQNLDPKIHMALSIFDSLTPAEYVKGIIYVFVNDDNKVEGRYYVE